MQVFAKLFSKREMRILMVRAREDWNRTRFGAAVQAGRTVAPLRRADRATCGGP